ncbi:1-phosphofructokinase family hexose kinase [Rhodovulum imhoffii]|nr:hexose kinase [Rhodovulum imhoffii]MBK5935104.1 sugar kinase [Rhodovulum imhoffii]
MEPILTVTLNPAVDISTSVARLEPALKLRCAPAVTDPGGGGINVSRAIRLLGGESHALVAIGGHNGRKLKSLLEAEGIRLIPLQAPGETRQAISITESDTGRQFRFVLPGPAWAEEGLRAIMAAITTAVPQGGLVVLSGSIPEGLPENFPARVCRKLRDRDTRLIVDTSSAALHRLTEDLECPPEVLRMDSREAEALAGRTLPNRRDSADFAAAMVARGAAKVVIVARGPDGSVAVSPQERLFAEAARVPVKSKVGAGDSFVAAFTLRLAHGAGLAEALQWGAAAASAAVMTDATALCTREDTEALLRKCPVSRLPD